MATAAAPTGRIRELTLRGIILGALITVVFTAANVYLGLKIGITFATSIPSTSRRWIASSQSSRCIWNGPVERVPMSTKSS